MLSEETMQRLGFVRYLFEVAVEQSRAPDPFAAASVLSFHDSVEMFLQLASEQVNRGKQNAAFMDYFELIDSGIKPLMLGQKESMRRMNKTRVNLKHYGAIPSRLDIESFRAATNNFFEENTPVVFGVSFSQLSLAHLVRAPEIRSLLVEAERAFSQRDHDSAIRNVAEAFARLAYVYGLSTKPHIPDPFPVAGGARRIDPFAAANEKAMHNMQRVIHKLEFEVKAMRFGLDLRRLDAFRRLTPSVDIMANGAARFTSRRNGILPNEVRARFCYQFVVESAIKLQRGETFAALFSVEP